VDTLRRNDINGMAWSPDGLQLASASQDGVNRIWDPTTEMVMHELGEFGVWKRAITWSANGQLLATSGQDSVIQVWDPTTGELLAELTGHSSPVWSAAWSPDGSRLATGSGNYQIPGGDTSIRLWGVP
jgi:WD40 repeat protein